MAFIFAGYPAVSFADVEVVEDKLKLFGDIRFRYNIDLIGSTDILGTEDSREQPQIRARIGAKYQTVLEPLSFGFRLATGGSTLNSPYNSLETSVGSGAGQVDFIGLDQAYAKLKFLENGVFIVGKQGYPFWQQTEQFWDEDIQPEGFTVSYTQLLGSLGNITGSTAYYYIVNNGWRSEFFDNDTLTAWQLVYHGNFERFKPTIAVTGARIADSNNDQDTIPAGSLSTEYYPRFYMFSAQLETKKGEATPGFLFGFDYHFSSWKEPMGDDHNSGFVVQTRIKYEKFGLRFYYYIIEEASVPFHGDTIFAQDNFLNSRGGGLAGFEGHRLQLDYVFSKNIDADFRIFLSKGQKDNIFAFSEEPEKDINRYQLNFNVKF